MTMEEIVEKIKQMNTDGRFNDLLRFIDCNGNDDILLEEEPDDLFKFLARAKVRNEYPELFKYIRKNNIRDPKKLLDYLRANN